MARWLQITTVVLALSVIPIVAQADTLALKDGTKIENCFVRDDGIRMLVWEKMEDVGTPKIRVIPRSQVQDAEPIKFQRDDSWNVHPNLPDLTIAFIEMNPKLAGLHWQIDYDSLGTPVIKSPSSALIDLGDEGNRTKPEEVTKNLKLKYKPGEEITLTANIRNVGFTTSKPFEYVWMIDDKEVAKGKYKDSLKELEWAKIVYKYKWLEGMHTVTFKITTVQPEISTINNEASDALWGWGFAFVINKNRTYHDKRNACGSFCFEDYYRWHVELMNTLFKASIFPSAPEGIKARVRLDRIIYVDDPNGDNNMKPIKQPDGIGYMGGMWTWTDSPEEIEKHWPTWDSVTTITEWSLPHELGHQLGIPDYYVLDQDPNNSKENHLWADNGEPVAHFMTHPRTMMHWATGTWSETSAGYFNDTWDKPRGYFGDFYFAIPRENFIHLEDVNGLPLTDAKIEIFQRGIELVPNGQPVEEQGVKYFPVVEDGNFDHPVSMSPVIVGNTDKAGTMRLPNRPAKYVKTLNGYERLPNPFGNITVVGQRGMLLVKVTKGDSDPAYYWLEITSFVEAWFRGHRDTNTFVLKTPFRSDGSPRPPSNVAFTKIDDTHVRVTWDAPKVLHEQVYIDKAIGYKVYRRVGQMGLNDRPWFCVGTFNQDGRECVIDLKEQPSDTGYYSQTERYAVSSLGELSMESELVEAPIPQFKQ